MRQYQNVRLLNLSFVAQWRIRQAFLFLDSEWQTLILGPFSWLAKDNNWDIPYGVSKKLVPGFDTQ